MKQLVRWETDQGSVIVEVDDSEPGFRSVSRAGDVIHDATGRFEDALVNMRAAAETALRTLRDTTLTPDGIELEFGVKLNAAAGAVIAKTSVEGHLKVKLTWGQVAPQTEEQNEG